MKLKAENISYEIQGKKLLSSVSFESSSHEIIGILGPNGAGKSTLFRILCGMLSPQKGTISIGEESLSQIPFHQRIQKISYLPQYCPRFEGTTIEQFVLLADAWRTFRGQKPPLEFTERLENVLQTFDVQHLRHRDVCSLSGGEWQRAQLARLWLQRAQFMFLDEPDTGLDIGHLSFLVKAIQDYAQYGSVIFSCHNLFFTTLLAQRLVLFHQGKVVAQGDALCPEFQKKLTETFHTPFKVLESLNGVGLVPLL